MGFNLGRCYKYLAIFTLLLASCQAKPVDTTSPTWTISPTGTNTATETVLPTETPTPHPTLTPEPAWYRGVDPSLGVLKYQYAEVTNSRARVYATFEDAVAKNGNYGSLPNFPAYIAYAASRVTDDGQTYYQDKINYGWIAAEDLRPLTSSSFSGVEITRDIPFRFGWVLTDTVTVGPDDQPIQTFNRYQLVYEVPTTNPRPGFIAVGAGEWLPEASVALVDPAVPADAGPNTCRFVYANIKTQTLSVYDQCKLVFATLISSGKNAWTFEGRFAILYKVDYSSITPPAESTSEYYIEGVPYFMTYAGNFGFHGAYWHDNFGTAASHGCINLSPADAKWLYLWAGLGERVIISTGK
jgi:lipoprotein-anchoring transpeptidase ErfK/SrfK